MIDLFSFRVGPIHHLFVLFGRHPRTRLERCFFLADSTARGGGP
jgi:hypothetical protein